MAGAASVPASRCLRTATIFRLARTLASPINLLTIFWEGRRVAVPEKIVGDDVRSLISNSEFGVKTMSLVTSTPAIETMQRISPSPR